MSDDYLRVNRANWDDRAMLHPQSAGYDLDRFRRDPSAISDVVRFDLPRLGEIAGLQVAHLQCHIGTDTLSLSRLGAHVTGLDFSPVAISAAENLARETGAQITYVCADVDSAVEALGSARFDVVYTGIGAIGWLPSIQRWASIVADLLRPGGRLFIREGHPILWATDDPRPDGLIVTRYPYFETTEPSVWEGADSYVETSRPLIHTTTMEWNHGLGEIITALLDHGLRLTQFVEHDSVPYVALGHYMEAHPTLPGEFWLTEGRERLPLSYTLQAVK
ncbi:class I SAM-dependent methyltransferase [Tessaracoccus sp.]